MGEEQAGAPTGRGIFEQPDGQLCGLYFYCLADGAAAESLGPLGIEGQQVYAIPYRELGAVVHDCQAQPYRSEDPEVVQGWALAHQQVVDTAWQRWGTVLPFALGTIITAPGGQGELRQALERWLAADYQGLRRKMAAMRGKAEYGVQVFWRPEVVARSLAAKSPELQALEAELRGKPRGLAYLHRQRLEALLRAEMAAEADRAFAELYRRIKPHVCDLKVERARKLPSHGPMLLNLSCLVSGERYRELGEELEGIAGREGFAVRFSGPWPPYSFVGS